MFRNISPTTAILVFLVVLCGWCVGTKLAECDFENKGCIEIPVSPFIRR